MPDFVHLHMHSEFSLLDGANRIKDLPVRAKELGMKAMAITDHGVMFGVIDFYKECLKNDIKPIIGSEVYIAPGSRFDKESGFNNAYYHLILLAKDNEGYKNLAKLVSLGFTEGYYYKPRIDKEILEKYHEGLICCSACLAGEVPSNILRGDIEEAKKVALWYKKVFGDDYYLEIQNNGIKEQVLVNQQLIAMSKELDIPLVATNDSHYLRREDAFNHEILLCIQTGKKLSDSDRMRFDTDELYVKSPEEMADYFSNVPEAIENTIKIADKCNVTFEFGHTILPNYDVPKEFETHSDYLEKLCDDGIRKRYGDNPSKEILDRAKYEMDVIKKMGYVDYFLIVWDYIHYAKSVGIPVGPGRGSGAGSIVAYAIEITDIDPIKYELLFERFLNPERISMPDFDIDFDYERRGEVIDYVERKYGHDHVSQIITFGTMAARMVIRDVARVLDLPYQVADKLAKMIPNAPHMTIKTAMEQSSELRAEYESNEETKKLIDIAMALEGMPRQTSTHACGIIIAREPVVNYVPLYSRDGEISTQFIMTTLEELGLLKMDFLGLRTLTVIQDTIDMVKNDFGVEINFDKDQMDDPKVFKLWQDGNSMGIFQFESQGMTNFMKELKPDCLEDIIAGVSLYRPGPMDQIPRYIANKKDPENAVYTHDSLRPILGVTYGCMVYQEQVMQIVRDLAGYSLGRADLVRRAMGKKKLDVMAKEREIFINGQVDEDGKVIVPGCVRNGIDEKSANKIFDEMAEFAKYAFNKSHAACYAVVAYRTAFLKAYYPTEFMAAMLNSFLGNLDKVPLYVDECKKLNVEILKPDINRSFTKFTVDNGKIRFGMGSVKNVGINAVNTIVKNREEFGEYKSFSDFCERISKEKETVNRKCIESLIKAGAFDSLGQTRSTLIASFEEILDGIDDLNKKGISGQVSMFDFMGGEKEEDTDANGSDSKYNYTVLEEYKDQEIFSMEKEMLGIYVSGHPLEKYKDKILEKANIDSIKINNSREDTVSEETDVEALIKQNENKLVDGQNVRYAGIITSVKKKYTKTNKLMAFVTVEDLYGTVEIIVFENCYLKCSSILIEENIVLVEGRLSIREDEDTKIVARDIKLLEDSEEENENNISSSGSYNNVNSGFSSYYDIPTGNNEIKNDIDSKKYKLINIDITNLVEEEKARLRGLLHFFNGDRNNIGIRIINGEKQDPAGGIFYNKDVLEEIKAIVGYDKVTLE